MGRHQVRVARSWSRPEATSIQVELFQPASIRQNWLMGRLAQR
ncbi:hypothetical protein SynBIOSU31_03399 [Synechococcus sp. BIOS-U3-1]|nr:hypothetical protein SynBIOSU31_03399 [Synechococcus sp. BIOS-U3-1]